MTLKVFDELEEAIVKIDKLKIIEANRKGEELGFVPGREIFEVFSCEDIDKITDSILKSKNFDLEAKALFFYNNFTRTVRLIYKSEHSVLIVRDITLFKNLVEAKRDFVVSISHELFNPLSALKGNVLGLLEKEFDEETKKTLESMKRSVLRMERIIKQLKLLSMVELGIYTPKMNIIDPKKAVEEALTDLSDKIKNKNIDIKFECKIETLKTDGFAFYTIVRNLVSNAVKYSYPNSVVKILIEEDKLIVEDRGIGIREEELERVFERFYRGKDAAKMSSGSGLGLSIVKHLCELLGYEIEVSSNWLIGSRFIVRFNN